MTIEIYRVWNYKKKKKKMEEQIISIKTSA